MCTYCDVDDGHLRTQCPTRQDRELGTERQLDDPLETCPDCGTANNRSVNDSCWRCGYEFAERELVTDGGTVEPATTQQTLTPTDDTPEPRSNSALEREWNDLRKHANANHEGRPWEITHCDNDTDADRAYELIVSWTTNFCMAADAAYRWDRFTAVWETTEATEDSQ